MAMSDERQRNMPTMRDRETGQILAYPEAVLLTRPVNPEFRGEVCNTFLYDYCRIYQYLFGCLFLCWFESQDTRECEEMMVFVLGSGG